MARTPSGTANSSALSVASANGYTNDGTTSKVTINVSPAKYSGGPNAGKALPAGYAEATVTWYQKRGFSSDPRQRDHPRQRPRRRPRSARDNSNPAVLLLSPTASPALKITGNAPQPWDHSEWGDRRQLHRLQFDVAHGQYHPDSL